MMTTENIHEYLSSQFADSEFNLHLNEMGDDWIQMAAPTLKEIMKFLRDDEKMAFDVLMCLSGVHYPDEEQLGVSYHLHSTTLDHKLAVKVKVPISDPMVPSIEQIWKTANWHEREAFDMVGLQFQDHPNHTRILCPVDWEGHPLKKDYEQQEFYHNMPTGE